MTEQAQKVKLEAEIVSQESLAEGIFSMWIQAERIAEAAVPGQFITLYPKDQSRLLPRPISLCEIDRKQGRLRLVYRVAGGGTKEFSGYRPGEMVTVLGPLGNGFPLEAGEEKRALIIGGGIGIPPLLQLAKSLHCRKEIVLGYRDVCFLKEEFESCGTVYAATEDGSQGTKGNVLDAIRENMIRADVAYCCGPLPMLRGLKDYAAEQGMECYLSLEERMACGIGACLACVCRSSEIDGHSRVHNKRVCKDGPVFRAQEVEL